MLNIPDHNGNANQNHIKIHLTPVRMEDNNKTSRMWGKRNLHSQLVGMLISTTTMESSMGPPQKTKNKLPYDPAIHLLGLYWK
jgi:hypothetical protein